MRHSISVYSIETIYSTAVYKIYWDKKRAYKDVTRLFYGTCTSIPFIMRRTFTHLPPRDHWRTISKTIYKIGPIHPKWWWTLGFRYIGKITKVIIKNSPQGTSTHRKIGKVQLTPVRQKRGGRVVMYRMEVLSKIAFSVLQSPFLMAISILSIMRAVPTLKFVIIGGRNK